MKLVKIAALMLTAGVLVACAMKTKKSETNNNEGFISVSAEDAKKMMDENSAYVILDVREQEEYEQGHIENALLLPDHDVLTKAESLLKNKDELILVYCRSGRRSKLAASDLVKLGYTNVVEFGGLIDWPYEIKGEE